MAQIEVKQKRESINMNSNRQVNDECVVEPSGVKE
jgi:hypothetical protein